MIRRIVALVLLCTLALGGVALAEEAGELPEGEGALFLPLGTWMLTDAGWNFVTETMATLSPAQRETAEGAGIALEESVLPAGTALSSEQLFAIYPGAEGYFQPPQVAPELEYFSLTGEWSYGDDGMLYYRHGDGYSQMTVDEVFAALNGQASPAAADEKTIYLTIDDSPSKYTMEMLAVLDKLDVTATFFILGAYVKQYPTFLRAIYDQGHAIANHSYSHDAGVLASSFKSCLNDFRRCEEIVRETLGLPDLQIPILRIPYGSSTIPVSYQYQLQQHGYMWIDWNALNGDTESGITSDSAALERAISTAGRYDGSIVMLVHDGKKRTIRTMEEMVKHFREQGYEFRPLDVNIEKIPGVRTGYPMDK